MEEPHEEPKKSRDKEMSFLDHLEQLRWHLIRSVLAVLIVAIAAFLNKSFVFDTILFAPKSPDFISFRALCKLSVWLHEIIPDLIGKDTICIGKDIPELQNIYMAGQFLAHLVVSIVAGLIVAFPYIFWEFWRFVKPALKKKERRYAVGVVASSSLLFLTGVVFGYFIIAPLSVNFLSTYVVSGEVTTIPTLSSYISIVTTIVLACGIIFELPLLVYFLTKVGIVTPTGLKKYRRHSLVAALVLSAIITPPDVFSQLLVAVPLLFLYEISIIISKSIVKKSKI